MSNYKKLQSVLTEIFEIDKADLDFGIYRIMNQKRDDINKFIDTQLPKDIKDILSKTQSLDGVQLQKELDQLGSGLDNAGVVRESSPKYLELKTALESSVDLSAMEQEIFSHLSGFFKRYYNEGDFISQRRYKKDVYAIPYEGEEVKLHWANADQYYIKTSEYLKDYAFVLPGNKKKVVFQLKEASTEQNNNKTQGDGERRFAIYEEEPIEVDGNTLYINFTYELHKKSVKQDDLIKKAFNTISSNIPVAFADICAAGSAPTEKNKTRTLIEKHLNDYVSRNTFDYFIHKDLGAFLRRELDFYIKNEILYIDDINTESPAFFTAQLSKIKAFKTVADKIITFLAQIEDFQKKLWLKKKFVIRTDYCITLDRIPVKYFPEIFSNAAQLQEWETLFSVKCSLANNQLQTDGEIPIPLDSLTTDNLPANIKYLVLDTQFFSDAFKDKLMAEFYNLEEETNGLLINSENFQALNLMQEKYQEKVDAIYIDPPYNTGDDGFIYKDNLTHSSWLSLMFDRNNVSKNLISQTGSFFCQINDKEYNNLSLSLNTIYGVENRIQSVNVKTATPAGFKVVNPGPIDVCESILFYTKNKIRYEFNKVFVESSYVKDYKYYVSNIEDEISNWNVENIKDVVIRNLGYKAEKDIVETFGRNISKTIINLSIADFALSNAEKVFATYGPHKPTGKLQELIALSKQKRGKLIFQERPGLTPYILLNGRLLAFYSNKLKDIDGRNVPTELLTDLWTDISWDSLSNEGNVEFKNGKKPEKLLKRIFEINNLKSGSLVLDYFAGSGTTVSSALKFGVKSIGVELGIYFNERTLKRIKHTLNGEQGGISKVKNWIGGGIIKYQLLESYEDTLNNLVLAQKDLGELGFDEEAQEEYLLQYMLDVESRDHLFKVEIFRNPFDYKLKVTENNELIPTKVDLVETFNYLIGLYVEHIQRTKDIKFVEGTTREGAKTLVIWRNLETTTNKETEEVFRRLFESERTSEFDQIYINGDHNLKNFRTGEEQFKVKMIEETFFNKMFDVNYEL